jgi:hypothetical protein
MMQIAHAADGRQGASGDHQVMETESPKNRAVWRIPGLIALAAIAVGGVAVAASARHVEVASKTATYPAAKRLEVDSGAGTIVVHGEDRTDIQLASRIRATGRKPDLRTDATASRLRVRASCQHTFLNWELGDDGFGIGPVCAANYTVSAPAATALTIDLGQGDIRGDRLKSPTVSINSGTGDIELDFVTAPRAVDIDSGTGDVTIRVPRGSYAIQTDTGTGDTRFDSGIVADLESTNTIRINSGTGDVTIERSDV